MLLFDQIQQFELRFGGPPADTSQFDAFYKSVDMGASLTDGDYAPAEIAEDLPESRRFGIDGGAAGFFVGVEKILSRPKPSDRLLIVAETPRTHAHPSDVLHGIAEMRQLPIEDRSHAFGAKNNIADSIIAVYERLARHFRNAPQEPSECQFERGMRFEREEPKGFFVAFDLAQRRVVARLRQEVEFVFYGIDSMNPRENFGELRGHRFACACVSVIAEQAARQGFAIDPLHDEKRRTENRGIFRYPKHLGNWNAFFESGPNHHELVTATARDIVSARIAAQHHRATIRFAATLRRAIERPDLARRPTRHLAKILDRDAVETAFGADEAGQPPDHFAGLDFLHCACSLPNQNEYHEISPLRIPGDGSARPSGAMPHFLCNPITEQVEAENRKPDRESGRGRKMRGDEQERAAGVKHVAPTGRGRQRAQAKK